MAARTSWKAVEAAEMYSSLEGSDKVSSKRAPLLRISSMRDERRFMVVECQHCLLSGGW